MTNFVLIVVCILAGMLFKATKSIHPDAHKGINTWIIYLALPAVSFKYLPKVQWSSEMLFPILSTVLVVLGSKFSFVGTAGKKDILHVRKVQWKSQVATATHLSLVFL